MVRSAGSGVRGPIVVLSLWSIVLGSLTAGQLVFRTGVDYVELDVIVTDKHDRAVKDLTKDDFEVTEHGKAQTLTNFQFLSIPAVRRVVGDVKTTRPTIDVVSNTHSPLARQWTLVIDDLHIIEQHILHTKKVVQEFLESLPADDQVAIVFVGRSDLSQGFTSDLGAQMRTINRIRDALGFAYDANDAGGGSVVPRIGQADRHKYGMASIDVLNNICASVAKSTYPRKALVYVSEGMTYDLTRTFPGRAVVNFEAFYARDYLDGQLRAFEIARRAGVPVYPIDPRGIPDCTSVRGPCLEPPWGNIHAQWNNMRSLAENTGGRAFVNQADMAKAVRELVEDNSTFYLLGYYPDPFARDGKFHEVKVQVKGRPDLHVRAKAGYTAPSAKSTAAAAKATLDDALGAALPMSGISLRAFAAPITKGLKGMRTVVTIEVTYPAPLDASKVDDTLQYGIVALDNDGAIKGSARHAYRFAASFPDKKDVTFAINEVIELPSQPLVLRIGVASQLLGKEGTIHVPVEAINPSKDDLQIGSIVIGFAGGERQAAMPPGALKDLVPFQPTTARTFSSEDTLRIFAPLTWRSKDTNASITLTVQGNGANVSRSLTGAVVGTDVSLKDLAPGSYALEITALVTDKKPATRTVAFEIR